MLNYTNGKIYKITCKTTNLVYIGSTTQYYLSERLRYHKEDYVHFKQGLKKTQLSSFRIIENDNFEIELIENYPCTNKTQLLEREKYYIQSIECVNNVVPCRTRAEYRTDNKDKIKEYSRRKWLCEICNVEVGIEKRRRHERCQRHINNQPTDNINIVH